MVTIDCNRDLPSSFGEAAINRLRELSSIIRPHGIQGAWDQVRLAVRRVVYAPIRAAEILLSREAFLTFDLQRLRRAGNRVIDLLGAVLFRRAPGVKNVRIERTKVWAGWGEHVGFFSLDSEVSLLRAVHAERGPIRIEDSPHYAYVRSIISRFDGQFSKEDWLGYVRVHSAAGNKYVQEKMLRFDALIAASIRGAEFEIVVRWNSSLGVFLVVDGFHRLACVAAIDPGKRVRCIVLL